MITPSLSLPVGIDGKPIPTPEMREEFLALCQPSFQELWDAMLRKASDRAYKGGWRGRTTIFQAWERIIEELVELKRELTTERFTAFEEGPRHLREDMDYEKILLECADVANFLVVLQDLVKERMERKSNHETIPHR